MKLPKERKPCVILQVLVCFYILIPLFAAIFRFGKLHIPVS